MPCFGRPPKFARLQGASRHVPDRAKLNDGVKGFMSPHGDFALFLELDHLRVMVALPTCLLAMKCLAMRIGAEYFDGATWKFKDRFNDKRHAR